MPARWRENGGPHPIQIAAFVSLRPQGRVERGCLTRSPGTLSRSGSWVSRLHRPGGSVRRPVRSPCADDVRGKPVAFTNLGGLWPTKVTPKGREDEPRGSE
jgi:hypothetical protein